jgi:hypothetical protein
MMLLRSLHAMAASRGDGLHPELLNMMTRSKAWAEIECSLAGGVLPDKPLSLGVSTQDNDPLPGGVLPFADARRLGLARLRY